MSTNSSAIELCVMSDPLLLITHYENHAKAIDSYLPYSFGIEIECDHKEDFNIEFFKRIPYIMAVDCDSSEQRFRIPNGLRGLICLYIISLTCKQQLLLNEGSGIHYHCDLTQFYTEFKENMRKDGSRNPSYIYALKELDTWEYKGTYNRRDISLDGGHCWMRFQDGFRTIETRIGEMTFEYELLVKRITHIAKIVTQVRKDFGLQNSHKPNYQPVDGQLIYKFLEQGIHIYNAKTKQAMERLEVERKRLLNIANKPNEQAIIQEISIQRSKVVKLF